MQKLSKRRNRKTPKNSNKNKNLLNPQIPSIPKWSCNPSKAWLSPEKRPTKNSSLLNWPTFSIECAKGTIKFILSVVALKTKDKRSLTWTLFPETSLKFHIKIRPTCKIFLKSRFQNIDLFAKQNSHHSLDKNQQLIYAQERFGGPMSSKIEEKLHLPSLVNNSGMKNVKSKIHQNIN